MFILIAAPRFVGVKLRKSSFSLPGVVVVGLCVVVVVVVVVGVVVVVVGIVVVGVVAAKN